jgi:hypothetical protein
VTPAAPNANSRRRFRLDVARGPSTRLPSRALQNPTVGQVMYLRIGNANMAGFLEAVKFEADAERPQKVVAAAYLRAQASDGAIDGLRLIEPRDLARCAELINRTHAGLDLFAPYGPESLRHADIDQHGEMCVIFGRKKMRCSAVREAGSTLYADRRSPRSTAPIVGLARCGVRSAFHPEPKLETSGRGHAMRMSGVGRAAERDDRPIADSPFRVLSAGRLASGARERTN